MGAKRGLERSLADFKRHPGLHALSILTITISLLILGFFFLVFRNYQKLVEDRGDRLTGTAYLQPGISQESVEILKEEILAQTNVQTVNFKSERDVLEDLNAYFGESLENLPDGKLFPDILEITLTPNTGQSEINNLVSILNGIEGVAEVDFSSGLFQQFNRMNKFFKLILGILVVAVFLGCGFMIANFMGMRMQSRKKEIEIVQIIGAPKHYILIPFLWEGLIEGLFGATLALVSLYVLQRTVGIFLPTGWKSFFGNAQWFYLSFGQVLLMFLLGIAMAFLGSAAIYRRINEAH